jgi:hypothetical protein
MFRFIGFLLALSLYSNFGFDPALMTMAMDDGVFMSRGGKTSSPTQRSIEPTDSVIVVPTGNPTP